MTQELSQCVRLGRSLMFTKLMEIASLFAYVLTKSLSTWNPRSRASLCLSCRFLFKVCACMPICMHMCVYVYVHVCACVCICVYVHVCACVCTYVCVYMHICVYVSMCVVCALVCMCQGIWKILLRPSQMSASFSDSQAYRYLLPDLLSLCLFVSLWTSFWSLSNPTIAGKCLLLSQFI